MSGAREQAVKWLAEAEQASSMDARTAAAQVAQVYALLGLSDRMDVVLEQLATRPRVVLGGERAMGGISAPPSGWPPSSVVSPPQPRTARGRAFDPHDTGALNLSAERERRAAAALLQEEHPNDLENPEQH